MIFLTIPIFWPIIAGLDFGMSEEEIQKVRQALRDNRQAMRAALANAPTPAERVVQPGDLG